MGRIFLGDQVNKLNPEFRIFLGLPADDGSNEIVNGSKFEFPSESEYFAFLYPKKYVKVRGTRNVLHDDYRQVNPYLAYSETRTDAVAGGKYAQNYYQEFRSINKYFVANKPADADFHVQIRVNPVPPVYVPEPEPELGPITFTYKEGKGIYNMFLNMTTQYTNGEVVTVEGSEGNATVDVPITFTAKDGYYLNNIVIDVDGKESSIFVGSQDITTKELIAKNVKPNSVVTVWGYGRQIPTNIFIYSEVLLNATSSMTGKVNIERGEHTITFYANEGFTFDSVGAYTVGGRTTDFFASGKEYSLTIDVNDDVSVDLIAVPISTSDSISPFVNIYEVTRQELGELSLERFSTKHLDLQTGATSSGVDYGDMIVNLIRIPYDVPDSVVRTRQPIKLGKFVTNTMSNLLDTNHIKIKLGSVKVEGINGNVSDYKNVRVFLYIPYADRMELPIEYVMDNEIQVTLELDLFSGNGVVIVTTQNVPVYKNMLTMSENIPFVQLRDTDYSNKINALLYGAINPFISLESHEVVEQVALPTQRDVVLNDLTGYVEIDRILSIDTKASVNEQSEIFGLLQRGVEIK